MVEVEGIEVIDFDVDVSSMWVEFGDVDEVELLVINGCGIVWIFECDGDEFVV